MQEVRSPLPSGAVIQGRYSVESLLGKGDFGATYLVREQHKEQKLFVLAEVFDPHEEESYRFTLEYVAPTSLDHQALPRVQYVFQDEKLGRAYVLMGYFEEPTLEMLRLRQPEKRFPLPKATAFMIPVIDALHSLHQRNPPVIHQNINPNNIIISPTLHLPVLIMLDLMKERNATATALHSFAPGYGAPEQCAKEISTRTDIYALGATCYTLLTGMIPPDALDRSTQLKNGEVDPLKPLHEAVPTLPASIASTIQRSMSLHADDRFSSVQQFKQALQADLRFQESPLQQLRLSLPEQGVPTVQQVAAPEEVAPTIADREHSAPEIVSLTKGAEEPAVPEVVSSTPTQSPMMPEKAAKNPVASEPKKARAWKLSVALIVIAFMLSFGLAAVFASDAPGYLVVHSGAPTHNVKSAKITPTAPSVSSMYPMITGTYSGTITDVSRNISTSMLLTGMRQNQGNVSGYLTLGPKLQGSGHFSGTIDTAKELKFVVTDSEGNATLFFEGVMQSATGLTGDYYRCNPVEPIQGGQCKQAPGSYGIWIIVLLS